MIYYYHRHLSLSHLDTPLLRSETIEDVAMEIGEEGYELEDGYDVEGEWIEYIDDITQEPYYVNTNTGETRYDLANL